MIKFIVAFLFFITATQIICAHNTEKDASDNSPSLSYLQAAILGTIQGITEFLPISSTGHLILTNRMLNLDTDDVVINTASSNKNASYTLKNASDSYAIIIQGGTILAIIFLYWKRILSILAGLLGRDPRGKKLARNILLAFFPAACMGFFLGSWIEKHLFSPHMVMIALIAGAILMFGIEKLKTMLKIEFPENQEMDLDDLTIGQSLTIGSLQCLALWPGMSRSMITIVGGYLSGLSISKAAEFSFLLGLVTLSAASSYKLITEGSAIAEILNLGPAIFGCAVAFITGAIAVKCLINYLNSHGLSIFAWYRLLLAIGIFFSVK